MTFLGDFRQAVQDALNEAFAATGLAFEPGRLADDAGREGAVGGVSTDGWAEIAGRIGEANVQLVVQVNDLWGQVYDVGGAYDPTTLEEWHDILISSLQAHQHDAGWFLRVTQVQFLPDPAGQRTRFVATVVGRTANPFETTGGAP